MLVGGEVSQSTSASDSFQKLSQGKVITLWWASGGIWGGISGWGALMLKVGQWWMTLPAISQPKACCPSSFVCPLLWDWVAERRKATRAFQRKREVDTSGKENWWRNRLLPLPQYSSTMHFSVLRWDLCNRKRHVFPDILKEEKSPFSPSIIWFSDKWIL